jgi:hypothetical protein
MFASDTIKTIDLPFAPGESAVIRKLSGYQLGKAQKAFFNDMIQGVVERGGAKVQKDIEELFNKTPEDFDADVKKVQADPLNGFDKFTLVVLGVNEMTKRPDWAGLAKDKRMELARDMDDEVIEFFATEIMKLTKPALFMTTREAEAEKKSA